VLTVTAQVLALMHKLHIVYPGRRVSNLFLLLNILILFSGNGQYRMSSILNVHINSQISSHIINVSYIDFGVHRIRTMAIKLANQSVKFLPVL